MTDPLLIEDLAQEMGNAGYCAYQPCREFLMKAFDRGRRWAAARAQSETVHGELLQSAEHDFAEGKYFYAARTAIKALKAATGTAETGVAEKFNEDELQEHAIQLNALGMCAINNPSTWESRRNTMQYIEKHFVPKRAALSPSTATKPEVTR